MCSCTLYTVINGIIRRLLCHKKDISYWWAKSKMLDMRCLPELKNDNSKLIENFLYNFCDYH